jgi:DNA end-binding protein Ku
MFVALSSTGTLGLSCFLPLNAPEEMEALKRSIGNEAQATKGKKPRKATAGQKEMLLPISGKRAAKQDAKKSDKPATARTRKRA